MAMALSVSGFPTSSMRTRDKNTDRDLPTSSQGVPGNPQLDSNTILNGPSRSPESSDASHSAPIPPPPPLFSSSNNLRSYQPDSISASASVNRPRGQSAATRPSLRLHIANPTVDPPSIPRGGINPPALITKNNSKPDNVISQAQLALEQDQRSPPTLDLYPTSVINTTVNLGGKIVNTNSSLRGRGGTFSNFTFGADAATSRSPSPPHIRITTTNLNMSAFAASTQRLVLTPSNSTPPSDAASASGPSATRPTAGGRRTQPTMLPISNNPRFPTVPSPANQSSATTSSASTTTTSIFTDDHSSASALSNASTPASLESGNIFTSSTRNRGRPLPVPPPPSLPPLSAIPAPTNGADSRASSGTRSRKTSASGPGAQQPQLVFDPTSSTWVIKPSGPRVPPSSKLGPPGQGYATHGPTAVNVGSGLTHASTHGHFHTHQRSQSDQLRELTASTPPPLPPPPTSATAAGNGIFGAKWKGKQPMRGGSAPVRSGSVDDSDGPVYRSEKWKGKQPMRDGPEEGFGITSPSPEPIIPYRSEKWKGKQPMRDESVAHNSFNEDEYTSPLVSPPAPYGSAKLKSREPLRRGDLAPDSSSDDFSIAPSSSPLPEPPSAPYNSAKWKGKQPIRGDTAPNSSNEDLGLPPSLSTLPSRSALGAGRGGVSKLKGKAREVTRTSSISSLSSVDKDTSSNLVSKWKGKGKEVIRKSGSFSSIVANAVGGNNNSVYSNYNGPTAGGGYSSVNTVNAPLANLQSASATSFFTSPTSSPIIPQAPPPTAVYHSPPIAPLSSTTVNATHPSALVPGFNKSSNSGVSSAGLRSSGIWTTMPIPIEPLNVSNRGTPSVPPSSPTIGSPLPPVPEKDSWYSNPKREDYAPMHTHPFEVDSDEEGRALYREVEAMYTNHTRDGFKANGISGRTREDRKNVDVDLGYGYAEEGYEDDERVYVDDGYDDPNDIGEDMEFGVSASGQLVGGNAGAYMDGGMRSNSGEFASSRPSLASQRRKSPSPIRYARRRRDSLFDDDDFDELDENSPVVAKDPVISVSHARSDERTGDTSPAVLADSFVYVPNGRNLSPPSHGRGRSREASERHSDNRNSFFNPTDVLGEETEMVFASNISPTRQRSTMPRGATFTGFEDRVYVRGQLKLRNPSPSTSPARGEGNVALVKGRGGPGLSGLRRYASEESLILVGPPEGDTINGSLTLGREFAPVRPRGFEEFNLAPNRYIPPPPELELKSKQSSHGHSQGSARPRASASSRPGGYDLLNGSEWKEAAQLGRQGRDTKRTNTLGKKIKRGLSVPRDEAAKDAQRNATPPLTSARKDDSLGRVTYDLRGRVV